jgi:hypothetical protein
MFRGYADCDLWGLDSFIVRKIYPALRAFVEMEKRGISGAFFDSRDDEQDMATRRDEVYQKILFAFEFYLYDNGGLSKKEAREFDKKHGDPYAETEKNKKASVFSDREYMYMDMDMLKDFSQRAQEGMELFGKYFCTLWD